MFGILAYLIALLATVSGSKLKPNHALAKQQDIQIPQHCQKANVSGHGFIARFYELDPSIGPTVSYNFFNKNYRTTLQGTVSGVTKVDFLFKGVSDDPIPGTIYGHDIIVNNFTLELSGFFRASASGIFTFKLEAIDAASFQIGTDQFCCNDAAERNTKLKNVSKHKDTFRLYKGSFYPFKIVMENNSGDAKLSLTIVDPAGREITDFASNIFQLEFEKGECFTTITQAWDKPHISTETESKKLPKGPKKVYVRVPKQTIYVTKTWTKSYPENSTETGALTDTVYIHLPVPTETPTNYWDGDETSTSFEIKGPGFTDIAHVLIPKPVVDITTTRDGVVPRVFIKIEDERKLRVHEVPVPRKSVTNYWDGDEASTSFEIKGPGFTDIAHVLIPKPVVNITTTRDGVVPRVFIKIEDERKLRVHEVPVPTETSTNYWDGDEASTSFKIKGPGFTDIAHVLIPKPVVDITTTRDGVMPRVFIKIEDERKLRVHEVPVPTETSTNYWDGDEASTSFEIKGPGFTDIAHVLIPKPVVDITTTRDGVIPRVFIKIEDERKLRVHEVPVPRKSVKNYWDGDEASTSFEIKGPGFTDIAHVLIPKPVVDITTTRDGVIPRVFIKIEDERNLRVHEVPVPTETLTYYWGGVSSSTTTIFNGPGRIDNVVVYVPHGGFNHGGYHKSGMSTRAEAKEIMNDHVASPGSVIPSPVAPNMDCVQQASLTLSSKDSLYGNQSESASSMHGIEGKADVCSSLSFEGVITSISSLVNSDSIFHLRQNAAGWNVSTFSPTESRFAQVSDGSIENVMSASASCRKCTSLSALRGSMSVKTEELSFNNSCYSSRENKHVADSPFTKDIVESSLLSESAGPIDPIYKQLMFGSQHGFHTSLPTAPPQESLFSVGSDIQDHLSESYCFKSLCPKNNTEVFSHGRSEVKILESSRDSKKTKLVISISSSFEQPKYSHMLIIEAETCKKSITLLILCIPLIIVLL